jgi:hypothetical protein
MLAVLKQWFAAVRKKSAQEQLHAWAVANGYRFARVQPGEGFVIHGQTLAATGANSPSRPWRLEWGLSQRPYISGYELRGRIELNLPFSLQMLLMSSSLLETLESEIFESSTHGLETHIDMSMPEEMRWLSMFVKAQLPRGLRAHFSALSSDVKAVSAWLDPLLLKQLEACTATLLADHPPFLLMTLRGRLYFRLQLPTLSQGAVSEALNVFETAIHSVRAAAATHCGPEEGWPSTAAAAWQSNSSSQ